MFFLKKVACVSFCIVAILSSILLYSGNLQAQGYRNYTIRGAISDQQTGLPLESASIILKELKTDAESVTISNLNGLFEFRQVQSGTYILSARYIGFISYTDTLVVVGYQQTIVQNIRLQPSKEDLDEVVISGNKQLDIQRPGQITIRTGDFKRVPTPAGSADLIGYLQSQPGVLVTGDRGGQLFVRGGLPSENMVLMDGSMVYQPFHIIGFFSIFPEEVISKVDLYAGGFGPRYNGRTSSVIDVKLKNGNLYERSWSASISPYLSSLYYESPIKREKSSFFVSLRGSMIEESSELYMSEQQPLLFNSQLIKYSSISEQGFNCSAHILRTYDRGQIDYKNGEYFKWNNFVTGGRCSGVSQESSISYFELNANLSYMSNSVGSNFLQGRSSTIWKLQTDVHFVQFIKQLRLDYGISVNYKNTYYDIADLFVGVDSGDDVLLNTGIYSSLNIPLFKNMSISPGFAFTTYLGAMKSSFEPRVEATWSPRGVINERINAAWGIYRQPIVGLYDFRDVGTAFTAWIPVHDQSKRMSARHVMLGWHQPVGNMMNFSIEGYNKQVDNIPVAVWSSIARFTTDVAYANGDIYGVDTRLNLNYRSLYAGIGYGYSWVEYSTAQEHFSTWFGEPVKKYHPPHDRRHQINFQTGLEIRNFSANISWIYGSGFPFTQPMGFDSLFLFDGKIPNVVDDYGLPRVLMEKPYRGQLPDFHRLDVSVEQKVNLSSITLKIQGGVLNAYNWKNMFYYDVFNQNSIMQLPLMPYLALKIESR